MGVVIDHQLGTWPSDEEWYRLLPRWFVGQFITESSEETKRWVARWRTLRRDQQIEEQERRGWALPDWLYFLEPDERQWFWWDASLEGENTLRIELEVEGWPAPLGSFIWLLRAAGAVSVTSVEDI